MSIYDDLVPNSPISPTPAPAPPPVTPIANAPTKSIYSDLIPKTPPVATPSPYFSTTTANGSSFGPSTQLDPSGKPLLDYRAPGDTSTTTDQTRVDTTFDPTVAAPHPQSEIATPRVVSPQEKSDIKTETGAPKSDVIDHAMALTLAGSNMPANLRPETNALNSDQGTFEEDLDTQVRTGKISLFDAQKLEAANKGLPTPFTGAQPSGFWDKVKSFLGKTVTEVKNMAGGAVKGLENLISPTKAEAATTAPTNPAISTVLVKPNKTIYDDLIPAKQTTLQTPDDFTKESSYLNTTSASLKSQTDTLTALKQELDNTKVDQTDQAAVDAYNAKVNDFNNKANSYQSAVSDFNSRLDNFNKSVDDYNDRNLAEQLGVKGDRDAFTPPPLASDTRTIPQKLIANIKSSQGGVEDSTPSSIPTDRTSPNFYKDLGDYLFNPNAEVQPSNLFTTPAERADIGTLKGPRIVTGTASIINNFMNGLINGGSQFLVDAYSAGKTFFGKSGDVKLPFNPERIGFSPDDITSDGKVKSITNSTLDRIDQLDAESPNTPNLNVLQGFLEKTFTRAIVNPLIAADVGQSAVDTMLSWSKSSPQLGLSSTELKNLSPQDAVTEVGNRFVTRARQITDAYSTDGVLSAAGQKQMAALIQETKNLGQAFNDGTIPQLNILGRFFDDMAIKLNQDVVNLGQPTSLLTSKINPADETLPGYRPTPGQAPAMGMSIQSQEPVGFGDNKPQQYHGADIEAAPGDTAAEKETALNANVDQVRIVDGDGKGNAEEEPGEIRVSNKETEEGLAEQDKLAAKESASAPTPLKKRLNDLMAERANQLEAIHSNTQGATLNKHFGRSSDTISQQLENAKGTPRARFIQDRVSELGLRDTDEAQIKLDNYKLSQKRLGNNSDDLRTTRQLISKAIGEDKDAKSIGKLLERQAKLTDQQISKAQRLEAIKKAEAGAAMRIADQQKYQAELENNVKQAMKDARQKEGIFKGLARQLDPLKYLRPTTKAITEKWLAHRNVVDILAKEEYSKYPTHTLDGMNTIIAQQDGAKIPWLTTAFEDMYTEGNRRGLDIAHQENYVLQVWRETGENIRNIIAKRMAAQGVDKQTVEGYLNGTDELDKATADKLKLNPSFSKEKVVPDYRTGIAMGLHPKYENPVQLIAYYRQEMEHAIANRDLAKNLIKNGDLIPLTEESNKPKNWAETSVFGKSYWAPNNLANFLNDYLRDEDNLSWDQKVAKNVATASHIIQNVGLMSGIPGTTLQAFPMSLLYTETLGYGNFKAFKPWLVANSSKLTSSWIESNWKYIKMMAEDGVPVGNLAQGEWNKETLAKIFKQTNLLKFGDLKSLAYQLWNRGWQTRVYDRLMPMLSTEMYKSVYKQQIAKGAKEADARKLAADSVKTKYVFPTTQGRTTQQVIRSIAYGPVWRQQIMKMLGSVGKGYSSEFNNPAYSSSRKLLLGLLATFAAYQIINQKTSGHFTWQNSSGHEMDIDIPHPDGSHTFVTFFPSFMTVPRVAVGVGTSLAAGDVAGATQQGDRMLNPIIQIIQEAASNSDYFGRPIYKPSDTPAQKYEKLAAYVGGQVPPSLLREGINYLNGKDTSLQALIALTGGLAKYQSASSAQSGVIANAITDQQTAQNALKQRAQQLYDQMKGSPTASQDWETINKQDPALAQEITTIATTANYSSQEKQLTLLSVKTGDRAQAIVKLLNGLSDNTKKAALWDKLSADKIMTATVRTQVLKLLNTK